MMKFKNTPFLPYIILFIASVIPALYILGKLHIGYDTFIPIIPENSYKMTYAWVERDNGQFIAQTYLIWVSILYILEKLSGNIYNAAFLYQFLIFFLSGLGIYKIHNLFNKQSPLFGLIPAILFIYSPHLLDHMIYFQSTPAIIWVMYFFFKFIKYKKFTLFDVIGISASLGFITDLPNPKYHFLLGVTFLLMIGLGLVLKLLKYKDVVTNIRSFILIIVASAYLILPFLYFSYSFTVNNRVQINTKQGYASTGQALDYGYAVISKMMRLFHTPNLNAETIAIISNSFFTIMYFLLPIIVLGVAPFVIQRVDNEKKRVYLLMFFLTLFFIFLSKSTNPPFGILYEFILSSPLLVFMRTTAGIVIFTGIFYSLLYGLVAQYFITTQKTVISLSLSLLFIFIIGFPYWSGRYFLNSLRLTAISRDYGFVLSKDYFNSVASLNKLKLDTKVDIYPHADGYQLNKWGYFGFIMYSWLINQPVVSFDKNYLDGRINSNTNALYIFHDKSLDENYSPKDFWHKPQERIFSSSFVDVYRKAEEYFIPHVYVPQNIQISNKITHNYLEKMNKELLAFYDSEESLSVLLKLSHLPHNFPSPVIEYRKIDPTKYRVRVHRAKESFPLVFTENFHNDWKIYPGQEFRPMQQFNYFESSYKLFPGNENDQATSSDVKLYSEREWVTVATNDKTKKMEFISKNFKGTIQNDNLPAGHFYETFFQHPLNLNHSLVNGYANSWVLDPKEICHTDSSIHCTQNQDGSYDFEILIEFWPQRLTYIGYVLFIGVAGSGGLYFLIQKLKKK